MKKAKDTNGTRKLALVWKSVRVLSASDLQSAAGGDGESGSKRPVLLPEPS